VLKGWRVNQVNSKDLKQKPPNSKIKKPKTTNRPAVLKSASWYANAALSIGITAKSATQSN